MGEEGNLFARTLVTPTCDRLLALQPGESVLDVACGTGVQARRMAALGAEVLGVDVSEGMLARARARGAGVDYRLVDAGDSSALLSLGRFDAVVCCMAWMDMPDLDPLLRATPALLKPGGRLVSVLCHPCFNMVEARLGLEQEERDGQLVTRGGVTVHDYLTPRATLGAGAPGEPNPHTYYHRPLQDLLGRCFAAGLVLDGLEEPAFPSGLESPRPLSWLSMPGIPPVIGLRLRPLVAGAPEPQQRGEDKGEEDQAQS